MNGGAETSKLGQHRMERLICLITGYCPLQKHLDMYDGDTICRLCSKEDEISSHILLDVSRSCVALGEHKISQLDADTKNLQLSIHPCNASISYLQHIYMDWIFRSSNATTLYRMDEIFF